jgi:hypothetical protein
VKIADRRRRALLGSSPSNTLLNVALVGRARFGRSRAKVGIMKYLLYYVVAAKNG